MNTKLKQILDAPMKTILAVRAAFDFCETVEDINEVIRKIPAKFGEFEILTVSEGDYFLIQNLFEKNGGTESQIVAYDFYKIKEDLYYDNGRKDRDV
jgi:hypothetical protein